MCGPLLPQLLDPLELALDALELALALLAELLALLFELEIPLEVALDVEPPLLDDVEDTNQPLLPLPPPPKKKPPPKKPLLPKPGDEVATAGLNAAPPLSIGAARGKGTGATLTAPGAQVVVVVVTTRRTRCATGAAAWCTTRR